MLLESVWNFHDDDTNAVWAITGDEYSPQFIDTELTSPRFNRTGEVWLWIQCAVAADYTHANESYQFILRSGSGNDATNLNAGIVDHVLTPNYAGNDTRIATARSRAFFATALPADTLGRYIQLYCDVDANGSSSISVYAGLASCRSAVPTPKYLETILTNVTAPTA